MKKVIFLNVGLLAILIYACFSYNHKKIIVNCEKPITTFSVLEVNCSGGYRGGSNLLIEFNAKQYYVGITMSQCKYFNPKKYIYFTIKNVMKYLNNMM